MEQGGGFSVGQNHPLHPPGSRSRLRPWDTHTRPRPRPHAPPPPGGGAAPAPPPLPGLHDTAGSGPGLGPRYACAGPLGTGCREGGVRMRAGPLERGAGEVRMRGGPSERGARGSAHARGPLRMGRGERPRGGPALTRIPRPWRRWRAAAGRDGLGLWRRQLRALGSDCASAPTHRRGKLRPPQSA